VKQALIVDSQGVVEGFVQSALRLYGQTRTDSLQEAEALASGADYDLVLIARPDGACDGAMWTMVERIRRRTTEAACVMVHTEDVDAAFHARAAALGVSVVTAPIDVGVLALIDGVSAG
jgi:CheY-like chemotaxis protein